nr:MULTISPECIES: response regulator [Pseudooceanicola]
MVEDEAIVALDLQFIVEDMGLEVMGPCATVRAGLRAVGAALPSVAILDVKLPDGEVFELADRLHADRVPLIFHSGHADAKALSKRYPGAAFCPKPTTPRQIESCVTRAMEAR